MARKFGGKYSPDATSHDLKVDTEYRGPSVDPAGAKSNVMFIPAIVVAATSLGGGAINMAMGLGTAALWTLGAWLLRDGLRAEAAFHERRVARRPAIPRKLFAAVLAGVGVGLAAYRNDQNVIASLILVAITVALHLTCFGLDPMTDKGMEGIDTHQQDRVQCAILRLRLRPLETRIERFILTARDLFRTVEEDPRDLTSARKYLSVYLQGARDATVAFVDVYQRTTDESAKADYLSLLDDLEQNFAARTQKLLSDDRTDLTIEIDVLRDRLAREAKKH
jgi:hypothetical protein